MLDRDDVGTVGQQVGRQPGRQRAHDGVVVKPGLLRGQVQRRAHQQFQRVGLGGAGLLQLRAQRLGLLPQRFHLRQVQFRYGAHFEAAAEYAQRFRARFDRFAGEFQPLVQFAQRQVAVGDLGDQAQGGGARGGLRGQVVLQRGLVQAAHAAPEVQLPARHADAHLVLAGDLRLAREVQVARYAAACAVRLGAEGGELVRALYAVQRARLFDPQQGGAQVAVVVQRGGDQSLQRRVGEIGLPRDAGRDTGLRGGLAGRLRGGLVGGLSGGSGPGLSGLGVAGGHRQGGALVVGRERRAARGQQRRQGGGGKAGDGLGGKRGGSHATVLQHKGAGRVTKKGRLVARPSGTDPTRGLALILPMLS
ncbi:hypothetical protein D3C85_651380 [compost metagenome]